MSSVHYVCPYIRVILLNIVVSSSSTLTVLPSNEKRIENLLTSKKGNPLPPLLCLTCRILGLTLVTKLNLYNIKRFKKEFSRGLFCGKIKKIVLL
jgi:hypothetical protein